MNRAKKRVNRAEEESEQREAKYPNLCEINQTILLSFNLKPTNWACSTTLLYITRSSKMAAKKIIQHGANLRHLKRGSKLLATSRRFLLCKPLLVTENQSRQKS